MRNLHVYVFFHRLICCLTHFGRQYVYRSILTILLCGTCYFVLTTSEGRSLFFTLTTALNVGLLWIIWGCFPTSFIASTSEKVFFIALEGNLWCEYNIF